MHPQLGGAPCAEVKAIVLARPNLGLHRYRLTITRSNTSHYYTIVHTVSRPNYCLPMLVEGANGY